MDNVHGAYLLKKFREERDSIYEAFDAEAKFTGGNEKLARLLARLHSRVISLCAETEYQIERAFDDMEKERAKKEGGAP